MEKMNSKTFLRNYGIFLLVIIVVFGITAYVTKITNKNWKSGLKTAVENVLNESEPDTWKVGEYLNLNNSMASNAAAFKCQNTSTQSDEIAVIVRVTTLYGPMSGVFVCDEENNVDFKGFSTLHGRIGEQLNQRNNSFSDKRVTYWKNHIPEILKNLESPE